MFSPTGGMGMSFRSRQKFAHPALLSRKITPSRLTPLPTPKFLFSHHWLNPPYSI